MPRACSQVGQTEAEEIGVEHLLRDVKDATISTLATDVSAKLLVGASAGGLVGHRARRLSSCFMRWAAGAWQPSRWWVCFLLLGGECTADPCPNSLLFPPA